jgi:hypothetical protein
VILFVATFAAMALGLAVAALVSSDAAALVMIPVLLVTQLVLSDSRRSQPSRCAAGTPSTSDPCPTHPQSSSMLTGSLRLLIAVLDGTTALKKLSYELMVFEHTISPKPLRAVLRSMSRPINEPQKLSMCCNSWTSSSLGITG